MTVNAVKRIVEDAVRISAPGSSANPQQHALVRFIDLDADVTAPRTVIPGVISEGVITFAGQQGIGKTTAIVPLSMVAAGLHGVDDPLGPKAGRWRHVVYVSEDVAQVQRIVCGLVKFGGLGIKWDDVKDRFHVVPAARLPISGIVDVADEYRDRFVRKVDGVELRPLVVFDTKSAVVALDEENSNSEASKVIAALKQDFHGASFWIITHLAKANIGRSDVAALTSRGANALEADAHGTAFLVQEDDERYIVLGKVRFDPRWRELRIGSYWQETTGTNQWNEPEPIMLRWGIPAPAEQSRTELRERAHEEARREADTQLRGELLDAVQAASGAGYPINRTGLRAKVRRKTAEIMAALETLIAECWLYEVPVPRALRTHPKRDSFLIRLTDDERRSVLAGQPLPPERLAIPPSWRLPAVEKASVPDGND